MYIDCIYVVCFPILYALIFALNYLCKLLIINYLYYKTPVLSNIDRTEIGAFVNN